MPRSDSRRMSAAPCARSSSVGSCSPAAELSGEWPKSGAPSSATAKEKVVR